jgi:flagellar biosynthetic protein FliO
MEPMGAVVGVLGLLIGLLFLVRRLASQRSTSGEYLVVLDTASLTPGQSLALVQVAGRCLVVGASGGHIERIAEFPATDLPAPSRARPGPGGIWLGRLRLRNKPLTGSA